MMSKESVTALKSKFTFDRVFSAFYHRQNTPFVDGWPVGAIAKREEFVARIQQELISGTPYDEITVSRKLVPEEAHEVFIDSDEELKDTLEYGWIMMGREAGVLLPSHFIINKVDEAVEHEKAHRQVIQSMPSVLSNYCVSFYTDRTSGKLLLQPAVTFVGTIPLRTLVDMAGNPNDPSHTDSIIASLKKFDLKR